MIVLEPIGGLCNRMRAICSLYELGLKHQSLNNIKVVWKKNKELYCKFESLFEPIDNLSIINHNGKDIVFQIYKIMTSNAYFDNNTVKVSRSGNLLISKELEKNFFSMKKVFITTGHQYYPNLDYSIFKPKRDIMNKVNYIIDNINSEFVGVHIRRTDNVNSIKNSTTEKFMRAIDKEIERNSNMKFYLGTDSEKELKKFNDKYGSRIISQNNVELNRSSERGIKAALVDLICLSKAKKLYGSYYSSFSEVAAQWNNIKLIIV